VGHEPSGCYASAAKRSGGINICMVGAGCVAYICGAGKTFSSGSWCTPVRPIGLLMRNLFGRGTPRRLAGTLPAMFSATHTLVRRWSATPTLVKRFGESKAHANPAQLITVAA